MRSGAMPGAHTERQAPSSALSITLGAASVEANPAKGKKLSG